MGDLDALRGRLDALVATVEERREERKAQRAKQTDEAKAAKDALVAEAEELAQSDQWRSAGERLRALVDTWKGLPRLDRKSDDELWHRFSHARSAFSKRRKAHFAVARRAARGGPQGQGEAGRRGRGAVRLHRLGPRRPRATAS